MGKRKKLGKGDICCKWTLKSKLGEGGNGEVWQVEGANGDQFALKILKRMEKEKYQRFSHEVSAMKRYKETDGVLPIIEANLPALKAKDDAWYLMPIAMPSLEFLAPLKPVQIVRHFIPLAETLAALHADKTSHRDIKLANILALNDRLCLADFGLVKYPERQEMTPDQRDVGPKFTMAPEMRRNASSADGMIADVYSFAKAIWVSLTKEEKAFDGQYSADSNLSLSRYFPNLYTTSLESLLTECTSNDPALRPTINKVRDRLDEWIKIVSDFKLRNKKEWEELLLPWFPKGAPKSATWEDIDAIIEIIRNVGKVNGLNHLFFPDIGGNTITNAVKAGETGFMEFQALGINLLKPKKLTFESFGAEAHWNYLWLEAEEVDAIGVSEVRQDQYKEYLTELGPGKYSDPHNYEYRNDRDGDNPLPEAARIVSRYFKGAFVIFSTRSPYNQNTSTYDARHEAMGEIKFKEYIAKSVASRT